MELDKAILQREHEQMLKAIKEKEEMLAKNNEMLKAIEESKNAVEEQSPLVDEIVEDFRQCQFGAKAFKVESDEDKSEDDSIENLSESNQPSLVAKTQPEPTPVEQPKP